METVTVLGAGYVGLTTAACLAHLGHRVHAIDADAARVHRLQAGEIDLLEPELSEMVRAHQQTGHLSFSTDPGSWIGVSDAVFLCLPTPACVDGSADLAAVRSWLPHLRRHLPPGRRIILKSTVPPGTQRQLATILARPDIAIISNPEFLREGHAIHDWLNPDRIIIGADEPESTRYLSSLYANLDAPVVETDPTSAELIKYAANTFLALKITYANTLAELCEHIGANITDVRTGIGHDPRIGNAYLDAGPGWGGPCLPKDVHALISTGARTPAELGLIHSIIEANAHHQRRVVTLLEQLLPRPLAGARVALLGLTFKAATNDLRDSPALHIGRRLAACRVHVTAYDPAINASATPELDQLTLTATAAVAIADADAVLVLTEWPEFATLPWNNLAHDMRGDIVLDTRG
ncbi:hypothetical protein BJF85_18130 [Saccharomonospora sp. CUA-673]|uniref:UDP-glucose dehydrogenase family protein n=1 Tax=Saccharomonospora sp. CUA-673 TaxID=1904969 RepID=UPI0009634C0B|nr:UDP-glucose/GDP-mannose dehydrogenase family protein [Saccharomonospora sp. CUA-673]OLT46089.1 hypothetical protein BJF85_18130 [Saccharomonospora sp. CUA-673]